MKKKFCGSSRTRVNSNPLLFTFLALCAFGATGCAHTSEKTLSPLSDRQEQFCHIRELHEAGKSSQLIPLAKEFLKRWPNEKLSGAVLYYLAANYEKTKDPRISEFFYRKIIRRFHDTGWADLASSNLKVLEG